MNNYQPEGMGLHRGGYTLDQLRRAKTEGTILQAPVLLCTQERDMIVDLGCCTGKICRNEAAIGARDGTLRDIAILSRVGKAVSFRVLELPPGGTPILSRRLAQEETRTYLFTEKQPGDILPAVVTSLANFGAFCDIGCGLTALLGIENISVSRICHSKERFHEDQPIFCVIRLMEQDTLRIHLSHKELLGTWKDNAEQFQAGQTVTGIVRSVKDYGAFIELTPNLSGLAEPNFDLHPSDAVSVYIKSIIPERLKIKLVALRKLDPASLPGKPLQYYRTEGHISIWRYGSADFGKTVTVF